MSRSLDNDLLERFETALREVGSPVVDRWEPGLADEQIDALLQPVGIDLPEEARVWWRWRNGVASDAPAVERCLWNHMEPKSLEYETEGYIEFGETEGHLWGFQKLLSPVGGQPYVYFFCEGARDQPVPIYARYENSSTPWEVLPSIGELIVIWLRLCELEVFDKQESGWLHSDQAKIPREYIEMGII